MAYFVYRFGDITLPDRMTVQEFSPVEPQDTLIQTIGGVYDNAGTGRRAPLRFPHPISIKAMQVSADANAFRTAIDALRAAVGTRAYLYRRADNDATIQTALCYLNRVPASIGIENHLHQDMSFGFRQLTPWLGDDHAELHWDDGVSLWDDGELWDQEDYTITFASSHTQTVNNGGNLHVTDVILTVTTDANPLSNIAWYVPYTIDLAWLSTVPAHSTLIIDCGAKSVKLNGVNRYNNLSLGAAHILEDWFELAPGDNTVQIAATGTKVGATWSVSFRDWWA